MSFYSEKDINAVRLMSTKMSLTIQVITSGKGVLPSETKRLKRCLKHDVKFVMIASVGDAKSIKPAGVGRVRLPTGLLQTLSI